MNQPISRPIGVTIIAVYQIIGGLLMLLAALGVFFASTFYAEFARQNLEFPTGRAFAIVGTLFLVFAALYFLLAFGLFKLEGWAWLVTLILQGLNVFISLTALFTNPVLSIFQLAISGLIIFYFLTPQVKRAFGRPAS